ncbi:MAG: hypothetical protein E6J90_16740 [Deltaproteobacteria bacterium]|nr:MAG: hypothetical protein E6J91_19685 [Deltaproteobacteria bacterium]TMQ20145.1 MAG: hypothetical protein E6J90_16740 [Deltaproteobacteria bacterium]
MKFPHWKNYEPIHGVTAFDAGAAGPVVRDLQVIANTHASDAYPEARVGLVIAGVGSVMLTAEQSAALRGHLERAERAVRRGGPPVTVATGAEGHCENCALPIQVGELVYVYEGDDDGVTVHAGPCPGEPQVKPERS